MRAHAGAGIFGFYLRPDDVWGIPIARKVEGGVAVHVAVVDVRLGSDQGLRWDYEACHMTRVTAMVKFIHSLGWI